MQKLLQRTAMAERQAARRAKESKTTQRAIEADDAKIQNKATRWEKNFQVDGSRAARRENWEQGPLASRRDIPNIYSQRWSNKSFRLPPHGTVSQQRNSVTQRKILSENNAYKGRFDWAGGQQYFCLAKGDRVAITEGPYRGRISTVDRINTETGFLETSDIKHNTYVVEPFRPDDMKTGFTVTRVSIPVDHVRLVHPVTDPATGETRDVLVSRLERRHTYTDKVTRRTTWSRVVPGLNLEIPWPDRPEPSHRDFPADTLRIDVEAGTYVPTLLRPPVPGPVLDELRNRYSRFRTRHEPWYLAKREADEAARRARAESVRDMRTPLQEFNREQRRLRRLQGQPQLSDEMLEKIGMVVAKNKMEALDAAGIEQVQDALADLSVDPGSQASQAGVLPDAKHPEPQPHP